VRVLVTGAGGLIGSEAVKFFSKKYEVFGIDNNMRQKFFGPSGNVAPVIDQLNNIKNYSHFDIDITDDKISDLFLKISPDVVIHCAAQPSHDKASSIPLLDFNVNAFGTINLLEATRKMNKNDTVFIHMSTNKVYGDAPNSLQFLENNIRFDYASEKYKNGIDESMSIDQCTHSLFGASKVSADVCAQEYGRYFGMNVGIFRGGCLTGPQHAGVELHGFLSYIIKCASHRKHYTIFGYKGKQVRDQIHCSDVIDAFEQYINNPKPGEVYNIGGCKENSASILEIINALKENHSLDLKYTMSDSNRIGDHICYYSNMEKFKSHYPNWKIKRSLPDIIEEMVYQVSH